ncbi:MAG: tRNA pseudouridine(54/55) synthase Pus10 [Zestosphaera sp.]
MSRSSIELLDKAVKALMNYPLCDRCLGRLFAKYGLGLSNAERGRALKTLIAMSLHDLLSSGAVDSSTAVRLAENGGSPIAEVVQRYVGAVDRRKCFICGDELDAAIGELVVKGYEALSGREFGSLLVGVARGSPHEVREGEVVSALGIESWESVRREVKREVGKRLQLLTGAEPRFRNPDVTLMIDLGTMEVRATSTQVFLKGRYYKVGRYISQRWWYSKGGGFRYKLSVEGVAGRASQILAGSGVLIHAAGREDADARMLGNGRPLVIEVRNPLKRAIAVDLLNSALSDEWVKIVIDSTSSPEEMQRLKRSRSPKTYRVVAYVPAGVTEDELRNVEAALSGVEVRQRTPKRILKRKKDVLRRRKVLQTSGKLLSEHLIELVVVCESGLYVKELVSGDDGRTHPSVSSTLLKEATTLFLDVLEYGEGPARQT